MEKYNPVKQQTQKKAGVTITIESSTGGATTLSRTKFSGYVGLY